MQTFQLLNHTLEIRLTTLDAIRCKSLGLDLGKFIEDPRSLGPTVNDPTILAPILHRILQSQLEAHKVTEDQFFEALAGDTLEAATRAFILEAFAFFPNAAARKVLIQGFTAAEKISNLKSQTALAALEGREPPATLSNSATNLEESPA